MNEMSTELGVGSKRGCCEKVNILPGVQQKGARWVPRMLTPEQRDHWLTVSQELLERHEAEGDAFLDQTVTGDETWCHYYELESKRQSLEWDHLHFPPAKNFRSQHSVGKVMCAVFWDEQGIILLNFLKPGATVNSERYIKKLIKLKARIPHTREEENILLAT